MRAQIETLTRQLESLQSAILTDWSLNALASSDRTCATITFTAVPASESEGQTLSLVVNLNGLEAESVPCTMDGSRYTATVELPAADGYSFYCLITGSTGTQQQIPLITPDNPGDGSLMDLGSSMNAYCSLFVDSWNYADGKLTLDNAFAECLCSDQCAIVIITDRSRKDLGAAGTVPVDEHCHRIIHTGSI